MLHAHDLGVRAQSLAFARRSLRGFTHGKRPVARLRGRPDSYHCPLASGELWNICYSWADPSARETRLAARYGG
eukprot:scaffold5819_cov115-Isochrysis_galbana.AAC.6